MAVNTIGDFIKGVFSPMVDRTDEVFKALFTDGEGSGTIEKIFSELEEERKLWEETGSDIYRQSGEQLGKTIELFLLLKKLPNDTDEMVRSWISVLFYRNGDTVWGNRQNILGLFKTFFDTENVFIVNNTEPFTDNLLTDGDFEEAVNGWNVTGGVSYDNNARFEGETGIQLVSEGDVSQTVEKIKANSVYFIHFFVKGKIKVNITDNNGRSWNSDSTEFGEWVQSEYWKSFSSKEWNNMDFYIRTDDTVDSIKVSFAYDGVESMLDYVRLNGKTRTSTFSVIVKSGASATDETSNLAPGQSDSVQGVDYKIMSYYDKNYILGSPGTSLYNTGLKILEIVKPAGIQAYLEILADDKIQ